MQRFAQEPQGAVPTATLPMSMRVALLGLIVGMRVTIISPMAMIVMVAMCVTILTTS